MAAQSAKFEAGQVHLAKDATWHAEFLSEILAFPNGRHDDQVDSVSQLLTQRQNVWMPMQAPIVVPFCLLAKPAIPWVNGSDTTACGAQNAR